LQQRRRARGPRRLSGVHGMTGGVLHLTHVDRLIKIYATALEASETVSDTR
jgi:hypothetical protein